MTLAENLDAAAVKRLLEVAEQWQATERLGPAARLARALEFQPAAQTPEFLARLEQI